ncbi:hypothetical protein ZWY2020_017952, partial [Hordeum vulgare]
PPPKPWERVGTSSGQPFQAPSGGSTSGVSNAAFNVNNTVAGPVPSVPGSSNRIWKHLWGYGASTYNSYGGFGGVVSRFVWGSGMYGGSMYNNRMGNPYDWYGHVAFLISQNTQAFHMFITALLQIHSVCWGSKPNQEGRIQGAQAPPFEGPGQQFVEAPKANKNSWENVWAAMLEECEVL